MKTAILIFIPLIVGILLWRIVGIISPDAVGMALGMTLGVLAGLPAAVLVLTALRSSPTPQSAVRYSYLEGSDRIRLRGEGLDGTWRRETGAATNVIVVTPSDPSIPTAGNTGRFRIAWQSEDDAAGSVIPFAGQVTRWAEPVDGVVVAAGVERERRMVWATEPVATAIASGRLCLVRADEWDAWRRSQRGGA